MIDIKELEDNPFYSDIFQNVGNRQNTIQKTILSPITNGYFPWLCVLLLVSSDNIKRPLIYFAIAHWAINSIGDCLYQTVYLYTPDYMTFPFSNKGYLLSIGVSSGFFLVSEILGDWYLLVRTKVLIRNNKKGLISLIAACLLFNTMKIIEVIIYIRYVPFSTDPEVMKDMNKVMAVYGQRFNNVIDQRLNILIFQQITSLIYDLLVIIILKKNVFVKNEIGLSNNTFLNKFKQLSEYRIYLGVLIALVASPFIFVEILLMKNSQEVYYMMIYTIRSKLLNFFYVFMYIDQISLKFFVEGTNVVRSTYKSNNSTNSKINYYNNNNSSNGNNSTLTYNKSNTSLKSLSNNYSNSTINYNNQSFGNFNTNIANNDYLNFDYTSQTPNYRYNNYNVVKNFNNSNSNSNLFPSNSNTSISDIFYNKLLYQNQLDNEDNKYLIDKNYHQNQNNNQFR